MIYLNQRDVLTSIKKNCYQQYINNRKINFKILKKISSLYCLLIDTTKFLVFIMICYLLKVVNSVWFCQKSIYQSV